MFEDVEKLNEELAKLVLKLRRIRGIAFIFLYGSFAREDFTGASDVDVAVLYTSRAEEETGRDQVMHVLSDVDSRIHVFQTNLEDMGGLDRVFLENIFREGAVLFGSSKLKIPVESVLSLKPYSIFTYTSAGQPAPTRKRLERALFKTVEVKKVGGEKRKYVYMGTVAKYGCRLGRGCILVPNKIAEDVRKTLTQLGIPHEEIQIYVKQLQRETSARAKETAR